MSKGRVETTFAVPNGISLLHSPSSSKQQEKSAMSGLDALQSAQFVSAKGKRLVVIDAEDWEALVDWLETLEDRQIVRDAFQALKAAGGDRNRAGWLEWKTVAGELG
jgi:hypothetical protein